MRIDIAYRLPPGNSRDHEAMRIMAMILASGDDSRLYNALVREQKAATQVFGFIDERRGPSALRLGAVAEGGQAPGSIEKMFLEVRS